MLITVNGTTTRIEKEELFLDDVLLQQSIHDVKGLAVAVNNSIVPREQWKSVSLKENDKVIIIRATQGG